MTWRGRAEPWVAAALLIAAGITVYANSFTTRFAGADAKESIRDNPHIRQLWPLSEAMSLPLLRATTRADADSKGGTVVRRPVLSLSFAMTYHLFGPEPWGFHAVNLAIHISAALLLFGVVRRTLLRLPSGLGWQHRATTLALAVALIWLVHPLQTESVTYIVQRAESQMALLLLLTLYCSARGFDGPHAIGWYGAAVVSSALAMGTKETASVLPVLVLLYDYTFVSRSLREALRRHAGLYVGLAATWAVLGVLIGATVEDVGKDFEAEGTLRYALAQPRVILHYLWLAVWPRRLYVYVSTDLFDVDRFSEVLAPLLLLTGVLALVVWGIYHRRWFGFVGAVFFLVLAPTSIVATSDVIQEHRMYLPLSAVVVLGVIAGDAVIRRLCAGRLTERSQGNVKTAIVVLLALALGARAWVRNQDYHQEFAAIQPADLHEQYMILTQHTLHTDRLGAAQREAEATLQTRQADPRDVTFAHFVLGYFFEERDQLDQSAQHFSDAIRLDPNFAYAHKELGSVLMRLGRLDAAVRHCERALQLKPLFPEADNELGMIRMQQGDTARAIEHFERAIRLRPDFAEAHYELGIALQEMGDRAGATAHLQQAMRLRPDLTEARQRLENAQ